MSLYRTYRPKAFSDVVGQENTVTILENAVKQDKLAHAYLFAGSRGTGKTSVARILAKAMLTHGIEDKKLQEQIRTAVDEGSIVDLTEIDGASNRGIDDIRSLVEKIQFSPVVASSKVYIIDEVHMLTKEAFNALLKTLEEPPAYAYFILATTELQKIPATIQSRCQRFGFKQVSEEDIIRRLQYIADQEKITIDRPALRAIAHHAAGGLRDAISLLDQLRSLPQVTMEDVRERIGESGHEYVEQIFEAIEKGDRKAVLSLVERIDTAGVSLENIMRLLLDTARLQLRSAIDAGQDGAAWTQRMHTLLQGLKDLRGSPLPSLVVEAALLSLAAGESREAPAPTIKKSVSVKPAPAAPAPAPEAPAAAPAKKTPDATVEAPELSLQDVRKMWPELLKNVTPASIRMSLKNGHVHGIKGSTVIIAFASSFHRDKCAKTDAQRGIEEILSTHFLKPVRVECVLESGTAPPASKDMVDMAQAAAEVF